MSAKWGQSLAVENLHPTIYPPFVYWVFLGLTEDSTSPAAPGTSPRVQLTTGKAREVRIRNVPRRSGRGSFDVVRFAWFCPGSALVPPRFRLGSAFKFGFVTGPDLAPGAVHRPKRKGLTRRYHRPFRGSVHQRKSRFSWLQLSSWSNSRDELWFSLLV